MKILKLLITTACLCLAATAQTDPIALDIKLPTYLIAGGAFNQYAAQRANIFLSAVAPVSSKIGLYESTTADVLPVKQVLANGNTAYVFSATFRQGLHKLVYNNNKLALMLGGDVGASFTQGPVGLNTSLTGSATVTPVYQISKSWAVALPLRVMWLPGAGWGVVPELGIVFKP